MRMSQLLNEVRNFSLDEGFSPKEIKMAIGIASDPRYARGNMTGAVTAIERMKKGLSKHPQVMAVLKRQNENLDEGFFTKEYESGQFKNGDEKPFVDAIKKGGGKNIDVTKPDRREPMLTIEFDDGDVKKIKSLISKVGDGTEDIDEAVSPAQQAAIAISKKERGEKPKKEGNTFGKELKAARDKGEKTFVVGGKTYNVEDLDIKDEPKIKEIIKKLKGASQAHAGQAKDLEKAVTEKFSDGMIDKLRKAYEPLRGKKIPPGPLMKIFDKIDSNKDGLEQLYKANIPFVSVMAMSRLMLRHNYKATDINKLGKINMEEFESDLDENKVEVGLDEAMYHHVLKNKVVASGSKSDMMKLVKKNGATIHKGPDSNYVLNSPGAKVGDIKEETLDEAVEDIFIKKGDVNQIAMRVARTARSLGLKAALKDGTVRIMGPKKKVSDFMRITIGKTSSGDASTVGKVSSQDDKLLDIQLTKEEVNEMAYKPGSFKDTRPQEKGAKALADLAKTGGMDKKDFEKSRALYVQASDPKSRKKLRDFIQDLDTSPAEAVMDAIGRNDPDTFEKMYPDAKSGEFLSKISFRHRKIKNEEVELNENKLTYVEYKFKNKNEAMKAKEMLLKSFNEVDDEDINRGTIIVDAGNRDMTKQHEEIMKNFRPKVIETRKLGLRKEEVELDEKYDLYHKDFSSAMQHAYSYAKSKMGITVDPKEIDSKVATGPKKPSEGKTNTYKLKGKGGNLQIQVYNKGGSKPFELNMYKEENELISQAAKHITTNTIKGKYYG